MARAYRLVYSSVAPSGELTCVTITPRSSTGDNSRLMSPSTAQDTTPLPIATRTTSQRTLSVQPSSLA